MAFSLRIPANAQPQCSAHALSEKHAREYRRKVRRLRGAFMTAELMSKVTKIIRSAIFAFEG
jgi:hypothetical protein